MAVTLQNLIDAASDLTDYVSNPNVSTATWTRWANMGIERAWRLMSTFFPAAFETGTADFTLTGGVGGNTTPRPANMRQLKHVALNPDSTSARRVVRRYNEGEKEAQGWLCYRIEGANVVIEPFQFAGGVYRLYYLKGPTVLVNVGDQMDADLAPAFDYVSTYMGIRGLDKEESNSQNLRADLAQLEQDLPMLFAATDSEPETVVDIEQTGRGPWPVWLRG